MKHNGKIWFSCRSCKIEHGNLIFNAKFKIDQGHAVEVQWTEKFATVNVCSSYWTVMLDIENTLKRYGKAGSRMSILSKILNE